MPINLELLCMRLSTKEEFDEKWGTLTSEQFLKFGAMEQFAFNMDVATCNIEKKLELYNRFIEPKRSYKLLDLATNEFLKKEFQTKNEVMDFLNISEDVLKYMFRNGRRDFKNPRYEVHNKYRLYVCRYDVIGDDYVLFDTNTSPIPKRENIELNQCL